MNDRQPRAGREEADSRPQTVAVIGGGVSGLAVTYELKQRLARAPGNRRSRSASKTLEMDSSFCLSTMKMRLI